MNRSVLTPARVVGRILRGAAAAMLLFVACAGPSSGAALAQATDNAQPPAATSASPAPSAARSADAAAPAPATETVAGTTPLAPEGLPRDLSPWGMFMAADWVVKAVMIGLAFASVVTWTVWFAKGLELLGARRRAARALAALAEARSLAEASTLTARVGGPAARFVHAAHVEFDLSGDATTTEGIKERVASRLQRIEHAAGRRIGRGTGVLATIGATAPFVGLFGTVWGIMNSFIGISKAQTTNLAVVAPGIAEALLATALGLVAAIPAVVIYNMFARAIAGYRAQLGDAAAEVLRLTSRDLDRAAEGVARPKPHQGLHRAAAE